VRRSVVTTLGALALVVAMGASSALGSGAPALAAAVPDDDATAPAEPTLVRVPFGGEAEVSIAEPWTVVDCDGAVVPVGVRVACEPGQLTFVADGYDPDYGTATLPLELVAPSGLTRTVTYRIEQAPPVVPSAEPLTYAHPFVTGTGVRVPWSDLELHCDRCDEGPAVEVTSVSPSGSAVAHASATHLVVQGRPGFVGESTVTYTLTDDRGQTSDPATVAVAFTAPATGAAADEHLVALDVVQRVGPSGTAAVDLSALVITDADETPVLVGCGSAVRGTVSCVGDRASYAPAPAPVDDPETVRDEAAGAGQSGGAAGSVLDQFSFHVATASGQQATGSITLVRADAPDALPDGPVRLRPGTVSDTVVPARLSDETAAEASPGLFAPFSTLLDRLGGTP
jgi:hypothetical protein